MSACGLGMLQPCFWWKQSGPAAIGRDIAHSATSKAHRSKLLLIFALFFIFVFVEVGESGTRGVLCLGASAPTALDFNIPDIGYRKVGIYSQLDSIGYSKYIQLLWNVEYSI